MDLTAQQKDSIKQWVQEGLGLADIQTRLREQYSLSVTYMDVRFMVSDLELELKDKARTFVTTDITKAAVAVPAGAHDDAAAHGGPGPVPGSAAGGVSVDVDRVTKPGALVSGTVRFSDGVSASWSLDQMGRLGLAATKPGYKPSEADIVAFQQELRSALEKMGL